MKENAAASFTGLVDLAAATLGGKAIGASDDFFAGKENLLEPGRGVFIEGKFTDRGKWMDGWESRRKRTPGHDHCIIELGARGLVLGFDVDTHHFIGNSPQFASIDGLLAPRGTPVSELSSAPWMELLAQAPLRPDAQNLFCAVAQGLVSHLRLNIFPDGGVARFRAYGQVVPEWSEQDLDETARAAVPSGAVDLAAVKNGGLALACSDAFFGPMNNLLLPGRAADMGGGWETRRKRAPGHDWILIKLAALGTIDVIEVDTHHFKGNYPDRCSVDVMTAAPGARITDLIASDAWSPILRETKLGPHERHSFRDTVQAHQPATHARLNIFPDGGVSRLRLWGTRR